MANISVFNIEGNEVGSIELSDIVFGADIKENLVHMYVVNYLQHSVRVLRVHLLVQKFLAAVKSHGSRRGQVMLDRDLSEHHSGRAAESYSLQSQEIIARR